MIIPAGLVYSVNLTVFALAMVVMVFHAEDVSRLTEWLWLWIKLITVNMGLLFASFYLWLILSYNFYRMGIPGPKFSFIPTWKRDEPPQS